jgi:hypothetical protein
MQPHAPCVQRDHLASLAERAERRHCLAPNGCLAHDRRGWLFRFGLVKDRPATFFSTGIILGKIGASLAAMERGLDAEL